MNLEDGGKRRLEMSPFPLPHRSLAAEILAWLPRYVQKSFVQQSLVVAEILGFVGQSSVVAEIPGFCQQSSVVAEVLGFFGQSSVVAEIPGFGRQSSVVAEIPSSCFSCFSSSTSSTSSSVQGKPSNGSVSSCNVTNSWAKVGFLGSRRRRRSGSTRIGPQLS